MRIQKVRHHFVVLMSGFLVACGGGGGGDSDTEFTSASTLKPGIDEVAMLECEPDARKCPSGKIVYRDPKNNCEFCSCPILGTYSPTCGAEAKLSDKD
jgi:hypothetical protein